MVSNLGRKVGKNEGRLKGGSLHLADHALRRQVGAHCDETGKTEVGLVSIRYIQIDQR